MERVVLKGPTLNPNFIGAWMMEPVSLCDELIDYFETQNVHWHNFSPESIIKAYTLITNRRITYRVKKN